MASFVNLTPHDITVRSADGPDRTFPPSGKVARVETSEAPVDPIDGIPVIFRETGRLVLPEGIPQNGESYLIVSSMCLDAASIRQRAFCVAPDTGATAIRNDKGQVVAVTRFVTA